MKKFINAVRVFKRTIGDSDWSRDLENWMDYKSDEEILYVFVNPSLVSEEDKLELASLDFEPFENCFRSTKYHFQ